MVVTFQCYLSPLQKMFDEAALSIEEMLVKTSATGLTYIAEWKYGKVEHKAPHSINRILQHNFCLCLRGYGTYGMAH